MGILKASLNYGCWSCDATYFLISNEGGTYRGNEMRLGIFHCGDSFHAPPTQHTCLLNARFRYSYCIPAQPAEIKPLTNPVMICPVLLDTPRILTQIWSYGKQFQNIFRRHRVLPFQVKSLQDYYISSGSRTRFQGLGRFEYTLKSRTGPGAVMSSAFREFIRAPSDSAPGLIRTARRKVGGAGSGSSQTDTYLVSALHHGRKQKHHQFHRLADIELNL